MDEQFGHDPPAVPGGYGEQEGRPDTDYRPLGVPGDRRCRLGEAPTAKSSVSVIPVAVFLRHHVMAAERAKSGRGHRGRDVRSDHVAPHDVWHDRREHSSAVEQFDVCADARQLMPVVSC